MNVRGWMDYMIEDKSMNKIKNYSIIIAELIVFPVVIYWICFNVPVEIIFESVGSIIGPISFANKQISLLGQKLIIFLILICTYTKTIRSLHGNKIIFHDGDYYKDYPYLVYWIGSKILNYGKCSLKGIPLYLQFKLLLNNIYSCFLTGDDPNEAENEKYYVEDKVKPIVKTHYSKKDSKFVNLVLCDTYDIKDEMLPSKIFEENYVIIKRTKNFDGNRKYNQCFIDEINKVLNNLEGKIDTINMYATTNPRHNKEIVHRVLSKNGRTSVIHINIAKQNNISWTFSDVEKVK